MREWLQEALAVLEGYARDNAKSNEEREREEPNYSGPDTFGRESYDALKRMIASPACETVWKAFERRCDPLARSSMSLAYEAGANHAERVSGQPEPQATTLSEHCLWREQENKAIEPAGAPSSRYLSDMARNLAMAAAEIMMEPLPQDTVATRRAKLREVEQAAEKLRTAIDPLWRGTRQYVGRHLRQNSPVDDFALTLVDRWLWQLHTLLWIKLGAESVAVAYQAAKEVARNPGDFLDALVADTKQWSEQRPELARPNDPNAARLLFIRKLTNFFRDEYREPLRASVLAVTSVFFDCSSLDESAIAKLAP